ncbi:MAG: hypothetical protein P8Y45_16280, partial [Exilibacterium sp.]
KRNLAEKIEIVAISNQLHEVTGEETLAPEKATTLGFIRAVSQEIPYLRCRSIDIAISQQLSQQGNQLIEELLNDLQCNAPDSITAYRHGHRWVQTFEPLKLENPVAESPRLKIEGVYIWKR